LQIRSISGFGTIFGAHACLVSLFNGPFERTFVFGLVSLFSDPFGRTFVFGLIDVDFI
jgi:hypothetical protein